MSPQQLLRETQRAAGDPRLTNWHDTLIAAGKEMIQLTEVSARHIVPWADVCSLRLKVLNSEKQQLKTLEDRNAMLERDVQRFNERKELERQVGFLSPSPSLGDMVVLDCARRACTPIHGIHGSEGSLHELKTKTASPAQACPDHPTEESAYARLQKTP